MFHAPASTYTPHPTPNHLENEAQIRILRTLNTSEAWQSSSFSPSQHSAARHPLPSHFCLHQKCLTVLPQCMCCRTVTNEVQCVFRWQYQITASKNGNTWLYNFNHRFFFMFVGNQWHGPHRQTSIYSPPLLSPVGVDTEPARTLFRKVGLKRSFLVPEVSLSSLYREC